MFANYIIHTLITIGYYSILAVSLNISMGYTGLINLGHVAFFAIGAYTSAIFSGMGYPFIVAILAAIILSAVFGAITVIVSGKAKGDYFALVSLGLAFVVNNIILNWRGLTKGPLGIAGIDKPSFFGFNIISNVNFLIFVLITSVIVIYLAYRLLKSPYGRLLEAVRDDSVGLLALGKNVFKLKLQSMMISAGMAGVAGSIFAHYITYIHPTNFFISDIVLLISIVIVGGLATVKGSVVATFVLIFLTESLRFVDLPGSIVGPSRLILYSLLLIIILMFRPRGLFGKVDLE